jgi:hypothetical protein
MITQLQLPQIFMSSKSKSNIADIYSARSFTWNNNYKQHSILKRMKLGNILSYGPITQCLHGSCHIFCSAIPCIVQHNNIYDLGACLFHILVFSHRIIKMLPDSFQKLQSYCSTFRGCYPEGSLKIAKRRLFADSAWNDQ